MGAAAKIFVAVVLALATALPVAAGQTERKPPPKGTRRVSIAGCAKGYVFTAVERTADEAGAGSVNVPAGTHIRMNGPKQLIKEIDAHAGAVIVITGIMREGQFIQDGVALGGGVRIAPPAQAGGIGNPIANQLQIDVEGLRPGTGECPR